MSTMCVHLCTQQQETREEQVGGWVEIASVNNGHSLSQEFSEYLGWLLHVYTLTSVASVSRAMRERLDPMASREALLISLSLIR